MNVDMSDAPEIALLTSPAPVPPQPGPGKPARPTIGALAAELRVFASQPERWWGAVRFSPGRSEKIDLEFPGIWAVVLAPGDLVGIDCDCEVMTVVAGAVTEESVADGGGVSSALRPGRMRVHGQGQVHRIRSEGNGHAVTLHVRGSAFRLTGNHHRGGREQARPR